MANRVQAGSSIDCHGRCDSRIGARIHVRVYRPRGLNFAASLRRINVILSRGSLVTFVISNRKEFGRGDLLPVKKYPPDTKEGLEALQRLFEWQGQLGNVYTLDTWRRVFEGPHPQVMMMGADSYPRSMSEIEGKSKWERLYYETWRMKIIRSWRPNVKGTSIECIEKSWQQFRVVFRIANNRRILSDTMAYCTQLWVDNIIGAMGGPNPKRVVRDNNTVLTVQNSEVPVKGWSHLSYNRYPLLLLTILLEDKTTGKGLYRKHTTMLGLERGQRNETESNNTVDSGKWYKISKRSKRSMIGLTVLAALELGVLGREWELTKRKSEEYAQVDQTGSKDYSLEDGQMVCIRLEPLRRLWERNDRTHWDQMSSYSRCRELKTKVQHLQ